MGCKLQALCRAGLSSPSCQCSLTLTFVSAALVAATDALVGSPVGGSNSGPQNRLKAVLAYATFHCASSAASYLSDDFVNEDFSFFGVELNGQKELKPRWKRVVSQANGAIGELVGKKYVERHFPKYAKDAAVRLVKCVKGAVEDRLRELPWMSDATKEKALEKIVAKASGGHRYGNL